MSVKIGISPIAWQNDDLPDLTADFTMEQCLKEARDIGYVGVERGRRMPADTEGLRKYLDEAGLALCGGWCSGSLMVQDVKAEIDMIRQQVTQFVALDAPCVVYAECSNTVQGDQSTPVNSRPKLTRDDLRTYGAKLTEVAKWMKDEGMTLAYHHHMGSMVEDGEDVDWLMEHTGDEVTLLYDTGHLLFGGADPLEVLRKWGHRVHHVHYKDVRCDVTNLIRAQSKSFLDAVIAGAFTVPGDGCIDFGAITRELAAMDYKGWIVVEAEQDPAKANPYDYSKAGFEHILQVCDAAGLKVDGRA